ncbi:hypothetical protein ATO8_18625 [Roseivivax marinus]|uniref:Uncharacterized protein n=1 Tax=Roseivivax marinus TaxID=1379903 RepID=W4HEJ2_9RHOB|nr:hypothetical protein [Roseivivax marinus]ETW11197.1 hypothetical protein ATO8_18625 [Roseivivax marinus]
MTKPIRRLNAALRRDLSNRTLGVFLVIGWMSWLLMEPLANVIDDHTTPQPWFDAEVKLGQETVHYTRTINRWMRGEWSAMVMIPAPDDGWRISCDRSGAWTYKPATEGTISMGFERFTGGCTQPEGMHRVCVEYVMEDLNGRRRVFGPFCSPEYTPRS